MIGIAKAFVFSLFLSLVTFNASYASENSNVNSNPKLDNSRIVYSPPNAVGLGIGLAFGGVGISYDRTINKYFALTAAIGDHPFAADLTYAVGAKAFYRKGKIWQPSVSVLYGTNTYVNTACELFCLVRHYEQFDGLSFGLGNRFVIGGRGKHSINFDWHLSLPSAEAKRIVAETDALFSNESHMSLSIGYHYYF